MKAFLLVFFVLAAVFNVPAPCVHALGLADSHTPASETVKSEHQHASHHGHDMQPQHTDHMDHAATSHMDEHHNCPDDCDGGANCNGCFTTTGAVETNASIAKPPLAASVLAFANTLADSAAPSAEPPPPRA